MPTLGGEVVRVMQKQPTGWAHIFTLAVAACSASPAPVPAKPTTTLAASSPAPASATFAPPPPPAVLTGYTRLGTPTLALTSAATCKKNQIGLGPGKRVADLPVRSTVGLDDAGGLAAWEGPSGDLRLQRFAGSGALEGDERAAALTPGPHDDRLYPARVVLLAQHAIVVLMGGRFQDDRWYAIVVDRKTGEPLGRMQELELHNKYVQDVVATGPRGFAILGMRALMAPDENAPGRLLHVEVSPRDGELTQRATDLAFAEPILRIPDRLTALRGPRGVIWLIERSDLDDFEVVADEKIQTWSLADVAARGLTSLMSSDDEVTWIVAPGDGEVTLTRVQGSEMVGEPTRLADPGSLGHVDASFHDGRFVIRYTSDVGAQRYPRAWIVDCRP